MDVALRTQLAGFPANWNLGSSALPVNYVLDAVNYINAARMEQHAHALIYLSVCEYVCICHLILSTMLLHLGGSCLA